MIGFQEYTDNEGIQSECTYLPTSTEEQFSTLRRLIFRYLHESKRIQNLFLSRPTNCFTVDNTSLMCINSNNPNDNPQNHIQLNNRRRKVRLAGPVRRAHPEPNFPFLQEFQRRQILQQTNWPVVFLNLDLSSTSGSSSSEDEASIESIPSLESDFFSDSS